MMGLCVDCMSEVEAEPKPNLVCDRCNKEYITRKKLRETIRNCRETRLYWNPKTLDESRKQNIINNIALIKAFNILEKELGL